MTTLRLALSNYNSGVRKAGVVELGRWYLGALDDVETVHSQFSSFKGLLVAHRRLALAYDDDSLSRIFINPTAIDLSMWSSCRFVLRKELLFWLPHYKTFAAYVTGTARPFSPYLYRRGAVLKKKRADYGYCHYLGVRSRGIYRKVKYYEPTVKALRLHYYTAAIDPTAIKTIKDFWRGELCHTAFESRPLSARSSKTGIPA